MSLNALNSWKLLPVWCGLGVLCAVVMISDLDYGAVVNNCNPNPNLLGGETHVHVVITRNAGTPRDVSEHHNVILKTPKEEVELARAKF